MCCSRRSEAKLLHAYDPTLGRFLSRDPLGRAPLFGVNDNPYVYAGNNPLSNVDPSGQRTARASAAQVRNAAKRGAKSFIKTVRGTPKKAKVDGLTLAKDLAGQTSIILFASAAIFGALAAGLQVLANYLIEQSAIFTAEAAFSFALPPIAAGFLLLAVGALTLGVIAQQSGYQARILAGESTALALAFGYESYDDNMTASSLQTMFAPALQKIVLGFAIASLLWSAWNALMGVQAIANLAVGVGKTFLLDGTLLAWSLGRVREMEADLNS